MFCVYTTFDIDISAHEERGQPSADVPLECEIIAFGKLFKACKVISYLELGVRCSIVLIRQTLNSYPPVT